MATTVNKQRIVNQVLTATGQSGEEQTETLPVLEQFIYALCRENATPEQAQQAYASLRTRFFDWNEVRVSTVRELEEALGGLSDAESRAQRILSLLQEVFEEKFAFELEAIHKKGVKQAGKSLMKYGAANDYVGAWVTQRTLGGHALPIDSPTMRCAKRLGLLEQTTEDPEVARTSLEHIVPKAKGTQFTDAISVIAEDYCWETEPNCQKCPLQSECPTAQEMLGETLAGARTARAKPR